MTILVTGTTGPFGRLAVEALLARGVAPAEVVATARRPQALDDVAARGVVTRRLDYDDPASIDAALEGVDRVLLVSGSEVGRRVPQHQNVIDAAARAGVSLIAYTSIVDADTTPLSLAAEHRATEELLRVSGVPHVLLRNSWYLENYTGQIPTILQHGALLGAAGDGRVSAATREDYAAAAAVVVSEDGHAGKVYELGGDEAFTMEAYAAELASQTGAPVVYRDLPVDDYASALVAAGLPEGYAQVLADSDAGIRQGALLVETGDLRRLIGRPATTMPQAITAALAKD
jgi:NAD(P)H dehydrogenase (quinone)